MAGAIAAAMAGDLMGDIEGEMFCQGQGNFSVLVFSLIFSSSICLQISYLYN